MCSDAGSSCLSHDPQRQAIEENQLRLKSLSELSHKLSRQHSVELKGRASDVQKRHIELSHRLLHVTRLIDALESRLASSLGYALQQPSPVLSSCVSRSIRSQRPRSGSLDDCVRRYRGDVSRAKEQELSRQLAAVEGVMAPGSASNLQRRLETVASAARLRSSSSGGGGQAAVSSSQECRLDSKSLQQLFAVLKEHAEGVKQLQEVLKRDQLDIQIFKTQGSG